MTKEKDLISSATPVKEPLISVVTCNYNCGRYLEANVRSVRAQTYSTWEHIIIDCGSTDESLDVLRGLIHKRLRVIEGSKCGVARGRNLAISESRGEYVAILDADDTATSDRLAMQIALMEVDPRLAAVGGGMVSIDESGRMSKQYLFPVEHAGLRRMLLGGFNPIPHSTLMFRRVAFDAVHGYCEEVEKGEDYELLLRLCKTGRVSSVPEVLVRYSSRRTSHSVVHRPKGRTIWFYKALAMITNAAEAPCQPEGRRRLEAWLDSIGERRIKGMLGRWFFRALVTSLCEGDLRASRFLCGSTLEVAWPWVRSVQSPWWRHAETPRMVHDYLLLR